MSKPLLRVLTGALLCLMSFAAQAVIVPQPGVSYFKKTVSSQGFNRTTLYFKPTTQAAGVKAPMLVLLHYNGGNAEAMAFLTEVSELVRDYGIWVMVPEVADGKWHHDTADTSTTNDIAYLSSLIDSAVAAYPVDARRVYMSGFSDGAMMTLRYACDRPEKIAAAASVAGIMLKRVASVCSSPARATPMLMINGTADTKVLYSGGPYIVSLSAVDSAKHWARINGCGAAPVTSTLPDLSTGDGTRVTLAAYLGCATGNAVEFYTVQNGGHTWPGSPYNLAYQGKTSFDLDATRAAWEFVKRFTR